MSYNAEMVKLVVLHGIADTEIKKEVLGVSGVNEKTLAKLVALIEDKEPAARDVTGRTAMVATSTYKKIAASDQRIKGTGKCKKCRKLLNYGLTRTRMMRSVPTRPAGRKPTHSHRRRTVSSPGSRKRRVQCDQAGRLVRFLHVGDQTTPFLGADGRHGTATTKRQMAGSDIDGGHQRDHRGAVNHGWVKLMVYSSEAVSSSITSLQYYRGVLTIFFSAAVAVLSINESNLDIIGAVVDMLSQRLKSDVGWLTEREMLAVAWAVTAQHQVLHPRLPRPTSADGPPGACQTARQQESRQDRQQVRLGFIPLNGTIQWI